MAKKKPYSNKELDGQHPEDFGYLGSREDTADSRTVKSRNRLRNRMEDQVAAFLKSGGHIQTVDNNIVADPPCRPVSNYGGRPI